MGLDGVELVMEVEDRFRISLSDEDCARVRSVADLTGLVVRELSKVARGCPTARSFFELRRAAVRSTPLERSALRPRTPLERIVPRKGRRRVWRRLRQAAPIVPPLEPSAGGRRLLRALGWTLFAGWVGGTGALVFSQGGPGIALGLALGIAVAATFAWTSNRRSTEFPDGCASLGDLAKRIAPTPPPGGDPDAERRISDDIRRITAERLGLRMDDVKPQSRFVDDLGMG